MSINPRPGMLRFAGDVAVFYMAICQQCDIALPHPTKMAREVWATGHRTTSHTVVYALDVRPDAGQTENRRRQLVDRLREKYSNPMPANRGGTCAGMGKTCHGPIVQHQRFVQWDGKLWHAECLDDGSYLRMASISDIAPGVFADVKPVTVKTWLPGDPARRTYGKGPAPATAGQIGNANYVLAGMVRKMSEFLSDATNVDEQPKKPNARERRRQRREGKQWQRKS